jgi:iron-sulfur cluster repair protein YtfE (RIC family)
MTTSGHLRASTMSSINAPTLLNDDGSASMATVVLMSHHGLRCDIVRFTTALRALLGADGAQTMALQQEWQSFHATLHGHHEAEDEGLFPLLRNRHAALAQVIDRLTSEHRRIDPLLEEGDRAFGVLAEKPDAAASLLSKLSELLDAHLASEEATVVPFLRDVRRFPVPATDTEAGLYAEWLAWGSHGVAEDVVEGIYAIVPGAVRAKIPAARAKYAERCERVWGTREAGASRTAVPEWLIGGPGA